MAKCRNCGRSYSLLTADIGSGLCRKCRATAGETQSRTAFDLLEKRFVFIVTRAFFWILCGAASLAFVAAVIVLFVNLVPAARKRIPALEMPAAVSISQADIERKLAPVSSRKDASPESSRGKPTASSVKPAQVPEPDAPADTIDPALKASIGTLKALFPPDKYAWASVYGSRPTQIDYWGRTVASERYLIQRGLEYTLERVLSLYDATPARVRVVKEAAAVIINYPVDRRGEAFGAWATLRRDGETNRQKEIRSLRSRQAVKEAAATRRLVMAQQRKSRGAREALRYAGAAFAGIAVVGLFLCFLAIERNTRMLQAMLEKEGKK